MRRDICILVHFPAKISENLVVAGIQNSLQADLVSSDSETDIFVCHFDENTSDKINSSLALAGKTTSTMIT